MGKWIVGVNIIGYLPDNEPAVFDTKRAAIAYASECARGIRDDFNDSLSYGAVGVTMQRIHPCTKRGSAGDYYIDNDDPYHLATHVWIERISAEEAAEYGE